MSNNKKLQVFVSSTFIDLQDERQAAVQAILNVGHIPAGMELFKAGDESQWKIIKDWIEESDVYLLIIGGRYGSIEPNSGKSYTQLEYEYATELNKPLFAIVINDEWTDKKAKKKGVKIEDFKEFQNLNKLNEFKETVKTKMVKFAEDLKDIKLFVSDSLHEISKRDNLKGWIKDEGADFSSISSELARLSKENSELKNQLADLNKIEKINGVEIGEFAIFLKSQKTIAVNLGPGVTLTNLLQYFYWFSNFNLKQKLETSKYGHGRYYNDCYYKLKSYGLYDSEKSRITDIASKLVVYLELNPHLLSDDNDLVKSEETI